MTNCGLFWLYSIDYWCEQCLATATSTDIFSVAGINACVCLSVFEHVHVGL